MALPRLDRLIDTVQRNCHVTDARYARGMTLCTYLLEMREFYRWENGIPLGEAPPRSEVGPWLSAREELWETLEDAEFSAIPLDGDSIDPFAVADINRRLLPEGLIYGAGIGRFHKPHFFLGRLRRNATEQGARVLVCGCEYARDLTAIPAALQGDTIVVRQEALRQWLWEKAEAWAMKRQPGAMQAALAAYGYFDDGAAALERMTEGETDTLILHEHGEFLAGRRLGPEWEAMLAAMTRRRAELLARAVRDNWADCISTLPRLLERKADASLHFWFSNFDGMRRELFPLLVAGYAEWAGGGPCEALEQAVAQGATHWGEVAGQLLQSFQANGADSEAEFDELSHDLVPITL
ncbi:MAG: hypothetical protein KJ787_06885 [Gammaproteobacteria bacterium]|nr:hypothetical protein [Gammaproteobacteria bacterium]MBU1646043.1 hypothetical protein [Gammaproteobacteria bacterium]MBU1972105.1 hypothetical protein [Gammaproteobacteria bacterium]